MLPLQEITNYLNIGNTQSTSYIYTLDGPETLHKHFCIARALHFPNRDCHFCILYSLNCLSWSWESHGLLANQNLGSPSENLGIVDSQTPSNLAPWVGYTRGHILNGSIMTWTHAEIRLLARHLVVVTWRLKQGTLNCVHTNISIAEEHFVHTQRLAATGSKLQLS